MSSSAWTLSDSEPEYQEEEEDYFDLLDDIVPLKTIKKSNKSSFKNKRSQNLENPQKIQEEKAKKQEEKRKLQEEKEKQKIEKKKTIEVLKQLKPGECLKFISAVIDCNLVSLKFGGDILTALQTAEINYCVKQQQFPKTISWIRRLPDSTEKEEDYVVFIWMLDEFIRYVLTNELKSRVKECMNRFISRKITIIVYGIEDYFRLQKTEKNRNMKANIDTEAITDKSTKKALVTSLKISRLDIEMALTEIQIYLNLQFRFVETNQELGSLISQLSKAIAELPYKLEQKKKHEKTEWYAAADSKECVRVDNDGNGLMKLWQQQLCQFHSVGLDAAQAILNKYNSPLSLIQAYDRCATREEAELLLQNIPVRRGQGPLTSVRRIGPELSKKMYIFFNNTDGSISLSQDSQ